MLERQRHAERLGVNASRLIDDGHLVVFVQHGKGARAQQAFSEVDRAFVLPLLAGGAAARRRKERDSIAGAYSHVRLRNFTVEKKPLLLRSADTL
jgi:hypothetical protein